MQICGDLVAFHKQNTVSDSIVEFLSFYYTWLLNSLTCSTFLWIIVGNRDQPQ